MNPAAKGNSIQQLQKLQQNESGGGGGFGFGGGGMSGFSSGNEISSAPSSASTTQQRLDAAKGKREQL